MAATPDQVRDACALVQASLTGDRAGAGAILANCDQAHVAEVLADMLGEAVKAISGAFGCPPGELLGRMRETLA